MRIFLDANILFSAAKSPGAIRALITQLQAAGHLLVADGYVVDEARRNVEAKFPQALSGFEALLREMMILAKLGPPLPSAVLPGLAEKDRPVLSAAIAHQCQVLVTGDKTHFGSFYGQSVQGVEIHSPASLARKLGIGPNKPAG